MLLILVKKVDKNDYKKLFIIFMSNNTPEAMTEQQRYDQKCQERSRQYYEENKERLQRMARD